MVCERTKMSTRHLVWACREREGERERINIKRLGFFFYKLAKTSQIQRKSPVAYVCRFDLKTNFPRDYFKNFCKRTLCWIKPLPISPFSLTRINNKTHRGFVWRPNTAIFSVFKICSGIWRKRRKKAKTRIRSSAINFMTTSHTSPSFRIK